MLIKVSIVHRTNTTSDATQLKPRRRGEGGGSTWPWKTLGASLPTFDEGWWCSGGVTRLVGGWCAVDHWFKPGKFIVDERRQNRGWLLLKCWIQTFPSLPLSFRLLALTYVSHPPPQRGEINLAPSPLLDAILPRHTFEYMLPSQSFARAPSFSLNFDFVRMARVIIFK